MLRRSWTVCAMTALLLGGTAAAQSPGTLLVGGFGQWTRFDSNWNLDTGFGSSIGYGGRLGAFIAPNWNIEADGVYTPASSVAGTRFLGSTSNAVSGDVKASAFTARLMYSFPLGNLPSIHIGAGGVLENLRGSTDAGAGTYQFGANGLVGFNLGFGGVALRVDGLVNYLPSNGGFFDFGAQAGLQLSPDLRDLMGGGATGNPVMWAPYVWWDNLDAPLPGTVELGGFAQWTWFDNNAGRGPTGSMPKNGLGYGGRVGVFLSDPRWELEGDGYYSPQDNVGPPCCGVNQVTKVNAHAFATRLNYNFPIRLMGRQSQFILGAGGTRTSYKFERATGPDTYTYNFGASGLAGLRLAVANRTALRLDGVIDYMPNHSPSANMNLHARAGLSFLFGGARPEVMCTFAGLESIPASSPNCVAPPPPPLPPPPPPTWQYNAETFWRRIRLAWLRWPQFADTAAITGPIYFRLRHVDDQTVWTQQLHLDKKLPYLTSNPE